MVQVLLRTLGIRALAEIGTRLPSVTTRRLVAWLLVLANLIPAVAAARGSATLFDVYGFYLVEGLLVWVFGFARIFTATGRQQANGPGTAITPSVDRNSSSAVAAFFALHFGFFLVAATVMTVILFVRTGGLTVDAKYWFAVLAALVIVHALDFAFVWLGQGFNAQASPADAAIRLYPSTVTLYAAAAMSLGMVFALGKAGELAAIVMFCTLRVVVDVVIRSRQLGLVNDA